MKSFSPPRLLVLATRILLQDEAMAVAAVEFLPKELFPTLFLEAIAGRHMQTVKAMVGAWPFHWLPLGYLLQALQPHQDILKAALDGLDLLLAPKVHPRGCKLKVLDLRPDIETNFWEVWTGVPTSSEEPQTTQLRNKSGKVEDSRLQENQPLVPVEVLTNLCVLVPDNALFTFLIGRVNERKGLPRLCCRKLVFPGVLPQKEVIEKILRMVQLEYVQEVSVNCDWDLLDLIWFAPYLGKMMNLNRLHLSRIAINCRSPRKEEEVEMLVAHFSSQLFSLVHLQHLHLDSVLFLHGHLPQLFRYMQTPLSTLKITDCLLLESDFLCLSLCSSTQRLKCLDFSGVPMNSFTPELLSALVVRASSTLELLNLNGCEIRNSHITRLLPALGHCSQLTYFRLYGNYVSSNVLENLLRHTAPRCRFRRLEFPVPLDCYVGIYGSLHRPTLHRYIARLGQLLQELELPSWIWFGRSFHDPEEGYEAIFIRFVF